ncbi:aldose epimerase family protein [Dyadobacter pollutisoli]|uniref:Aldose 1-epimerase n=1 Tax=Dyadobacter pollutisoli TaxID=2910158 RepID=A0A9E8NDM7_9BACT|nr:aldose epimerase family protein [Dyadobacter pollutisoli]WAC14765.1 galactose mutarotase [Dyadobacter pollutisoli]
MSKYTFGTLPDGNEVSLFLLKNSRGYTAEILNYGGTIRSLNVPDRNGKIIDVVLGFELLEEYVADQTYIGALVGRYANRIANGTIEIGGEHFQLSINNGKNCLHGGFNGFNKKLWEVTGHTTNSLQLSYTSPDGEEGFPGNLTVKVAYTLTEKNELKIEYRSTTDKPTHINFTQHSYFNLSPASDMTIANHFLQIHSDSYLPNNEQSLPTGSFETVSQTPFSFVELTKIGDALASNDIQMKIDAGINHSYVLKTQNSNVLKHAVRLVSGESGITMDTFTTEPGIHIYCANYFDGQVVGKSGKPYAKYAGICLETQHFADSPHQPHFPSTLLLPGQEFTSTTLYAFR